MHLLVISYYLPQLVNPQAIQVGRLLYHLPSSYRMHAVTIDDTYLQRDDRLYPDLFDKFEDIMRIPSSPSMLAGRIRIPGNSMRWHLKAAAQIAWSWRKKKFDRILTFAAPMSSNVLGLWLQWLFRTPWIAFFSDPWADNGYTQGGPAKQRLVAFLERLVMKRANKVVFTCPEARDFYVKKYSFIAGKALFIEHSFDETYYEKTKRQRKNGLVIRHIGSLYGDRNPSLLLRPLDRIKNTVQDGECVLVEIVGNVYGRHPALESLQKHDGPGVSVRIRTAVSYCESIRLMEEADVLVAIDMHCEDNIFLMSKLIEYIGSGRPILAIAPAQGATARIIREVGGWLVEPGDPASMETALGAIIKAHRNGGLEQYVPNPDKSKTYSITSNIDKFARILG